MLHACVCCLCLHGSADDVRQMQLVRNIKQGGIVLQSFVEWTSEVIQQHKLPNCASDERFKHVEWYTGSLYLCRKASQLLFTREVNPARETLEHGHDRGFRRKHEMRLRSTPRYPPAFSQCQPQQRTVIDQHHGSFKFDMDWDIRASSLNASEATPTPLGLAPDSSRGLSKVDLTRVGY